MAKLEQEVFVFRVDASHSMGSGHVIRCLTLADAIRTLGGICHFIYQPLSGSLEHLIEERGYPTYALPLPCNSWHHDAQQTVSTLEQLKLKLDWLIVDHYDLDYRWHYKLRSSTHKILVIDDLANRPHECDLLLDQSYGRKKTDYDGLLPDYAHALLGSQYALLRPQFAQQRKASLARHAALTKVEQILITMGGSDPNNMTSLVLDILDQSALSTELNIDIVIGSQFTQHDILAQRIAHSAYPITLHENIQEIALLMLKADMAIGAGGTTSWERCCLGLPTLLVTLADNQIDIAKALHNQQAIYWLGDSKNIDIQKSIQVVNNYVHNIDQLKAMAVAAAEVCDGLGCQRVLEFL
jgi:UDP-2,4-diacetamido-2,4,6-trideoxy-beta-L-altropyranose hydrolase